MKLSFITTVLNEESTINESLESIFTQTLLPDEVIIVDGGSSDNTISKIKNQILNIKKKGIFFRLISKKGNRAVGRNEAIKHAKGDIILCSDAGCMLKDDWVEQIIKPFMDSRFRGNDNGGKGVDVVAGYYEGKPYSVFQKCLIPYVLVMSDKVDKNNFLPASRSMAFRKTVWGKVGGFPESLSHNEDYVYARRLKKIGAEIIFQKEAIVYWLPRKNFRQAFKMFIRFAYGDAEARMIRPKVVLLFARYFIGLILVVLFFPTLYLLLVTYIVWAIKKNYKYVRDWRAFFFLPLLQLTSDIAVLAGTTLGIIHAIWDTRKRL